MKRAFLLAGLLFLAAAGPAQDEPKGYKIGDVVQDFSLPDTDGTMRSLKGIADGRKFVVLDFWSKNCPYSRSAEPRFQLLHQKWAPRDVAFFHVNANRTENATPEAIEDLRAALKAAAVPFPALIDRDNKVADLFGAQVTPTVYVIDAVTLKLCYSGLVTDDPRENKNVTVDYVDAALAALSAGGTPAVTSTTAQGCTIKRVRN
jgi:thiol-disulfide isomerase/thioredoxin